MIDFDNFNKIDDCIAYNCQLNPDNLAFSLKNKSEWFRYSRKEFWDSVCHYDKVFSSQLKSPSLILFIKKNDFSLLAAYIGAIKAGHYPAQISPFSAKTSESEYTRKIKHILDITSAKVVFTDNDYTAKLSAFEYLKVFTPESLPLEIKNAEKFSSDLALVQFSSGSTGLQKGVMMSHQAIINHMKNYSKAINLSENDKIVSWLPLYHDMGLIACYLMPLMFGIPFYQIDPFDWILSPDSLFKAIEEFRTTICFLPNFAYHVLINKAKEHDLSSMRIFINCSEPARADTHQAFINKFHNLEENTLSVSYALAENTFAVSQRLPGKNYQSKLIHGKELMSCGEIIPGTEVKIFNQDEQGVGEIGIRGSSLFTCFLNADYTLEEGFYLTGDLGLLADNELFITGRKKDLIIVNGKNIYPQDIEHIASEHPGVYPGRTVAFGIVNSLTGSEELFLVVETDGSLEKNQLKISLQKAIELEVGIIAKRVEVAEYMALVKTSSGKISRSRNKELYITGGLRLL